MSTATAPATRSVTPPPPDRKLRVLVIAELCNPAWVSTPLGGWSSWNAISKLVDGHLVTQIRNQKDLRAAGLTDEQFTAIDSSGLERQVVRAWDLLRGGERNAGWSTFAALQTFSYYWFEHLLWKRFGKEIEAHRYDIVHRVTPVSPAAPSLLAARCARAGVPFVLGPINGGLPWPKGFNDIRIKEKEWLGFARGLHRYLPGYRSTRRAAAAILVGSRSAHAEIPRWALHKTIYVPGNAVEPGRFTVHAQGPVELPLRIVFLGRFTRLKGADMLIDAAAPLLQAGKVELELVGDGPAMADLQAHVAATGLQGKVAFPGWVKHQQLQERLVRAHVFGFPSIREYGGAVVLEAMALGLVPVVMDYGGPPELVSPSTGFSVPMGERSAIVAGLRAAFEKLVANPSLIRAMGDRARQRVMDDFTWSAKAAQIMEVYRWVLGQRDRPDFGMPLPDRPDGAAR